MDLDTDEVVLASGPLTAILHGCELRAIRVAGHLALDGIYATVRDAVWGTDAGEVSHLRVHESRDGFAVTFGSTHRALGLRWTGRYEATAGRLRITLDGEAIRDVSINRIGFCLLHPMELVGAEVRATTVCGPVRIHLPDDVSPDPLLTDVLAVGYDVVADAGIAIDFCGDRYEMEDHRNWSDAGWKTYSPPLHDPYPRTIRAGERIRQRLEISAEVRRAGHALARARRTATSLSIGPRIVGRLPQIGVLVGERSEASPLRAIRPQVLSVQLRRDGDAAALAAACQLARELAARVAITISGAPGWVLAQADRIADAAPARVSVSDRTVFVPQAGVVPSLREALRARGCTAAVGAASSLFFAELNRMPERTEPWDSVAFPITPQVHHCDAERIVQTLLAQPYLVSTVRRRIKPATPIVVEPLAFRARRTPALPAAVDDPVDSREQEPLGAAWLLGSAAALAGVDTLTYLVELSCSPEPERPDLAVLRLLCGHSGRALLEVRRDPRRLAALAVHELPGRASVLMANLTDEPSEVRVGDQVVELPGYGVAQQSVLIGGC